MKYFKIFLVIVIVAVIGIAIAFLIVNWDSISSNTNVEHIDGDNSGINDSETPDNDDESESPDDSTQDSETPIQPGGDIYITISRDKIIF